MAGGLSPYLLNRPWLIHRFPANVDPIGSAASFPDDVVSPAGPIAASLDFQSGPSTLLTAGVRLAASVPSSARPAPGAMSKMSGPTDEASAGRMAAS